MCNFFLTYGDKVKMCFLVFRSQHPAASWLYFLIGTVSGSRGRRGLQDTPETAEEEVNPNKPSTRGAEQEESREQRAESINDGSLQVNMDDEHTVTCALHLCCFNKEPGQLYQHVKLLMAKANPVK